MDVRTGPRSAPLVSPHAPPPLATRAAQDAPVPDGDRWTPSATSLPPTAASSVRAARMAGIGLLLAISLCGLPVIAHDLPVPALPPAAPASSVPAPVARPVIDVGTVKAFPSRAYDARGTGYYPKRTRREGGPLDMLGHKLHTLQDYLAGKAKYVSVAMDTNAGLPYGTRLQIPELENKFHRPIEFRVVDTGDDFQGKGTSRIDICVRNHAASLDPTINGPLTLIPRD